MSTEKCKYKIIKAGFQVIIFMLWIDCIVFNSWFYFYVLQRLRVEMNVTRCGDRIDQDTLTERSLLQPRNTCHIDCTPVKVKEGFCSLPMFVWRCVFSSALLSDFCALKRCNVEIGFHLRQLEFEKKQLFCPITIWVKLIVFRHSDKKVVSGRQAGRVSQSQPSQAQCSSFNIFIDTGAS